MVGLSKDLQPFFVHNLLLSLSQHLAREAIEAITTVFATIQALQTRPQYPFHRCFPIKPSGALPFT